MKAIDLNGTIKTFTSVPKSWKGKIGLQYASDSELEALGFYNVNQPELTASQEYGAIEWDSENSQFTYPVLNKSYSETLAELKEQKINTLKAIYKTKLAETDWYIIRSQEGTSAPQEVLDSRSALRTECATKETEINALNTKSAVVDYQI
jgi:hypothetical protein